MKCYTKPWQPKSYLTPGEIIESRLYLRAILKYFDVAGLALELGYTRSIIYYWTTSGRNMSGESFYNLKSLCARQLTELELEKIAWDKKNHMGYIPKKQHRPKLTINQISL